MTDNISGTSEPQSARGEQGSRDTGSNEPSGGPVDRPEGAIEGDESVPSHGSPDDDRTYGGTGTLPPEGTEPAVPPYEGRRESADG